jgi:tetratricopeptide (TPR) repeat protein
MAQAAFLVLLSGCSPNMTPDISDLTNALDLADGYLILRMWEHAWNAIEDMPSHWKNHPDALRRRLDALTGLEEWGKASALAYDAISIFPRRADLWLRRARLQAQEGDVRGARESVAKCIEIREDMRLEVVRDEMLAGIW